MGLYITITGLILAIIFLAFILTSMSERYDVSERNSYILLFNRRTRKIREEGLLEYEPSPSWEMVGRIQGSHFWRFITHLQSKGLYGHVYTKSPKQAIDILKQEFKEYAEQL